MACQEVETGLYVNFRFTRRGVGGGGSSAWKPKDSLRGVTRVLVETRVDSSGELVDSQLSLED